MNLSLDAAAVAVAVAEAEAETETLGAGDVVDDAVVALGRFLVFKNVVDGAIRNVLGGEVVVVARALVEPFSRYTLPAEPTITSERALRRPAG